MQHVRIRATKRDPIDIDKLAEAVLRLARERLAAQAAAQPRKRTSTSRKAQS